MALHQGHRQNGYARDQGVAWLAAHPTRKSVAASRQTKKDKPHG
jgi:hypothetical protein